MLLQPTILSQIPINNIYMISKKNSVLCIFAFIFFSFDAKAQTVKDIDRNTYKTIRIGTTQIMTENLRVKRYQNGSRIVFAPDESKWKTMGETGKGAWCYFNNDSSTAATTGLIYNHYVVADKRKVCPLGWRVPTKNEWESLLDSLIARHPEFIPKRAVRSVEEIFLTIRPTKVHLCRQPSVPMIRPSLTIWISRTKNFCSPHLSDLVME